MIGEKMRKIGHKLKLFFNQSNRMCNIMICNDYVIWVCLWCGISSSGNIYVGNWNISCDVE